MIDLKTKLSLSLLSAAALLSSSTGCMLEKKDEGSGSAKDANVGTPATEPTKDAGADATSTDAESGGGSWSLAEEEAFAKIQADLDIAMKLANDRCKSSLVATINRETFRGHLSDSEGKGNAGNYCGAAISAIDELCNTVNGDEAAAEKRRATVRAKLTTTECRWGGPGKGALAIEAKKLLTTIDITVENSNSYKDRVEEFLKSNL
ncbi:MAG: hypothetical protein JST00_44810 [Deltaproteobacteria bacterium]|nr:hypothetical protein [Deltaproteobacteria bacterium]